MICKECGFMCNTTKALKIHITKKHNLDGKHYYIKHIKPITYCIECGKESKFLGIDNGFDERCAKCRIKFLQKQHYQNMSAEQKTAIANKNKATKLKNHNDANYNNISKAKNTKLKKYGNENYNNRTKAKLSYPHHTTDIINKQIQTHFSNWKKRFSTSVMNFFNVYNVQTCDGYRISMQCAICHKEFSFVKGTLNNYIRLNINNICPYCFPTCKTSRAEREVFDFIISLGEHALANDHTILGKKEMDIYVPEKKIGIEYDGLFWHSIERGNYISDKTELCEQHGIRCIHIFEDEWLNKPNIVKNCLSSIFGHNTRIYARNTEFRELSTVVANDFLEQNHLQGKCTCKYAVGLYMNNILMAVMTFGNEHTKKHKLELLRFATKLNINIIGGASKLFKHFMNIHPEIHEICAYADRRWSNGDLYFKLGFVKVCEHPPKTFFILGNTQRLSNLCIIQKRKNFKYNTIYDCGTLEFKYTRSAVSITDETVNR